MSKARKVNKINKSSVYTKAIAYCRVSSDRQRTEGHGLDSQEHRCRDFAKQSGYEVVQVFKDSYSGGGDFRDRPELEKLLKYVDDNPHEHFVVIIDDLSRFARDVSAHFLLKKELESKGVKLQCTNFNFEDTPEGEMIETFMAAQHQYHRKNNRRQVIQKQTARLEAGYWAFGARKGYEMVKDPLHGKLSVPTEEGLKVLKIALEGFADGTFARKVDVCEYLVKKGFWSKQRPIRYIDKLTDILRDPFYAGYIEYPKWEVQRRLGHHKGIISLETFEKIQKRLSPSGASKRIRTDISDKFPLRGLLVCADCGCHITGAVVNPNTKPHSYYYCQNHKCSLYGKMAKKKDVEDEFGEILKENKLRTEVGELVQREFEAVWTDEVKKLAEESKVTESEIKVLEGKLVKLTDAVLGASSEVLRLQYEKELAKSAEKINELNSQKITSKTDLNIPYRTALEKAIGLVKSPYDVWVSLELSEQHELFPFLFDGKLSYDRNLGYRNPKNISATRLFEEFAEAKSLDVEMSRIEPESELGNHDASTVCSVSLAEPLHLGNFFVVTDFISVIVETYVSFIQS